MRLLVLSDLHLEVWGDRSPPIDTSASRPDAVILAGDIHTKGRAPAWAADTFPGIPVLYIAGNHEFYGGTIDKAGPAIRQACKIHDNVHYLDCDEYVLPGVRFLGATLWTDFGLFGAGRKRVAMRTAGDVMNDYHRIKTTSPMYRKLPPWTQSGSTHKRRPG